MKVIPFPTTETNLSVPVDRSSEKLYNEEEAAALAQRAAEIALSEMKGKILYLDNGIPHDEIQESEDFMGKNTSKIRRHINVNGAFVWITADNEQDYAEKLMLAYQTTDGQVKRAEGGKSFREFAETWYDVFSKPNIATVTANTYRRQLDYHILPVLGDMCLEEITPEQIQEVFNRMGCNVKQATKNKVKIVLNQIFEKAVDDGLLYRNPVKSRTLRIKGVSASETEPYTVDDMKYLKAHLNDIQDPTDRAWLALSISAPFRPEEVLGLLWEDVDSEHRTITVRNTVTHPNRSKPEFKPYTKTASSIRKLVLPAEIFRLLPPRGKPREFVIGGETPLSYTTVRNMRKRIARETGFQDKITPRRFRTTVATDISAETHDMKLVQRMLGHANPQTTLKHYDKGRSTAFDASDAIERCYSSVG